MIEWKDISSYSRSDRERVPQTWQCRAGRLSFAVTRHIHYPPDVWLLFCEALYADPRELESRDIEAAKDEALAIVRREVAATMAALE